MFLFPAQAAAGGTIGKVRGQDSNIEIEVVLAVSVCALRANLAEIRSVGTKAAND